MRAEFETIKKIITHASQITGLATPINIVPQTSKKNSIKHQYSIGGFFYYWFSKIEQQGKQQ